MQLMSATTRILLALMALGCSLASTAQRRMVVADVETRQPIGGANVVSSAATLTSDSLGRFTVPDSCRSLIVTHVNYESRIIRTEEVRDTVWMISKLLNVQEVVVFGKAKYRDDMKELRRQLRISKQEAQLLAADPSSGGNLLPLLGKLVPKRWLKNTKKSRRERLKRTLEEY